MKKLDKIRWIIGAKKPVEGDLTKLKTIELSLLGPVEVSWTSRLITSDEITDHVVSMYWDGGDALVQLETRTLNACTPWLLSRQPILVSDIGYTVKMIEGFTLPPSRIFSPFISPYDGMVGFSITGWAGYRYLVEKE